MEEQKLVERPLMSEEEFKEYLAGNRADIAGDFHEKNILHLRTFGAVSKFKSVRRAIKRGHVSLDGFVFPERPFNNRSRKKETRPLEIEKERIYEQLKHRKSA